MQAGIQLDSLLEQIRALPPLARNAAIRSIVQALTAEFVTTGSSGRLVKGLATTTGILRETYAGQ